MIFLENRKLAVLITCHNRKDKTLICLAALYKNILPESLLMNVYLVDDGSTDGTSEAIKNEFPKVKLIQGNGNLFWNRGMLLAWESAVKDAAYDYFLWLNDDTLLIENSLNLLIDFSQNVKNERIIVGSTCSMKEKVATYGGYTINNGFLIPNGTWQNCDYFNGNIVLIPAFVFQKVGFLDKRYSHAIGDIDYGLRALKMGLRHWLSPVFLGYCENHKEFPVWCNRSYPLLKRLKNLYTPLGNNTIEFFIFDQQHNGLVKAVLHFFTIHIRTFFPSFWENRQI